MTDLQQAANAFASVMSDAWDADDMWHAMQWGEALAMAELMFQAGHGDLAQEIVRWWLRANDPNDAELADLLPNPAVKLSEWQPADR
ncbi:hypothetical protein [Microbacterium panaciterrae]|uniref:Uncharacterized protein n=1 Tax=Microbacterium panaciterrae TaxID=985759 RepID=A0ABP8PNE8_9MICO